MFFDDYDSPVFRPPSEARSFILRLTKGCAHNECTFCSMYKGVQFAICSDERITKQIELAAKYGKEVVRRIFLADGDALVLPTPKLLEILHILYQTFPHLQRVSSYAGPKDILKKSPQELQALQAAGLKLLYYGLETGDNELLQKIKKGVTAQEAIAAGQKVVANGFKLSMMVILGLAGKAGSSQHARATAYAINCIQPQLLSALTLSFHKGCELTKDYEEGRFTPSTAEETLEELQEMLSLIEIKPGRHTIFRSNHASNYLPLGGTLPQDKAKMLAAIPEAFNRLEELKANHIYNENLY